MSKWCDQRSAAASATAPPATPSPRAGPFPPRLHHCYRNYQNGTSCQSKEQALVGAVHGDNIFPASADCCLGSCLVWWYLLSNLCLLQRKVSLLWTTFVNFVNLVNFVNSQGRKMARLLTEEARADWPLPQTSHYISCPKCISSLYSCHKDHL